MLYKFIVAIIFLFFIFNLISLFIGVRFLLYNPAPIFDASFILILLTPIFTTLISSTAIFSIIRYFKFKKLGLSFLPEAFLEVKPTGYKIALVCAWLGHFGLIYFIFLRLFTFLYAGALGVPLILYIICICIMEFSIATWYKNIGLKQAK